MSGAKPTKVADCETRVSFELQFCLSANWSRLATLFALLSLLLFARLFALLAYDARKKRRVFRDLHKRKSLCEEPRKSFIARFYVAFANSNPAKRRPKNRLKKRQISNQNKAKSLNFWPSKSLTKADLNFAANCNARQRKSAQHLASTFRNKSLLASCAGLRAAHCKTNDLASTLAFSLRGFVSRFNCAQFVQCCLSSFLHLLLLTN